MLKVICGWEERGWSGRKRHEGRGGRGPKTEGVQGEVIRNKALVSSGQKVMYTTPRVGGMDF